MVNKKRKNNIILFVITLVIILVIFLLMYHRNNVVLQEKEFKCIAERSELYTLKTCPHCAEQKRILGDYLEYFTVIDCLDPAQIEKCKLNDINKVPAWKINNSVYFGVRSLEELKRITGC